MATGPQRRPRFSVLPHGPLALAGSLIFWVPGCFEPASLSGRPCPCADGFVCCTRTNMCVPRESAATAGASESGSACQLLIANAGSSEATGPSSDVQPPPPHDASSDGQPSPASTTDASEDAVDPRSPVPADAFDDDAAVGDDGYSSTDRSVRDAADEPTGGRLDAARDADDDARDSSDAHTSVDAAITATLLSTGILDIGRTAPTDRYYKGTFKLSAGEQLINRNTGALYVAYYGDNTPLPPSTSGLLIAHTFVSGGPEVTRPPATPPPGEYKIDNVTLTYAASSGTYTWSFHGVDNVYCDGCQYIDTMYYRVIIYTTATGP